MNQYQPESYLLYDRPYNCRLRIELEDEIDGELLSRAANTAIKRYPYFSVAVAVKEERYELVPNSRPVVVYETKNPNYALGSKEVNGHLISLDYKDHFIFFNVSHSIAGASGIIPWLKTVLYLYLSEKYQISLASEGIRLPDSPLLPGETDYPQVEKLSDIKPAYEYDGGSGYFLSKDYKEAALNPSAGGNGYYCMEIDQTELMNFVRKNDSSPSVIMSVFMFQALDQILDADIPVITCGMAHNFQAQAGCPNTYQDLTRSLHMKYTRNMADWPTEKLGTITRGMVMLQSQTENALYDLKTMTDYNHKIDSFGTLQEKRDFCRKNGRFIGAVRDTYNVSYIGKSDWGSLSPYIQSLYTITNGHLNIEINAINGKFYLCFHQVVGNKGYFETFCRILDRQGISYEVKGFFQRNIPGTELPS